METTEKSGMPSVERARELFGEAERMNPGAWADHSRNAARAARLIAGNCCGMDADRAYVFGLLHDIGRRYGVTGLRHIIDGYRFLMEQGYPDAARICLTHSFDCKDIRTAFGRWDCSDEEYAFVRQRLEGVEYDDYDRLIQLCDALADARGFCLVEKRMLDAAIRHGINEFTTAKWKMTLEILDYFGRRMGKPVYGILPGVVENTFRNHRI